MRLREYRECLVDPEARVHVRIAQNILAIIARVEEITEEDRVGTFPVVETIEMPWRQTVVRDETELNELMRTYEEGGM